MSETATPRPESAQLDCPECHTSITYYDVTGSEYYACPNCHAYFRWSGEETPEVFGNYKDAPKTSPVLPLGTLGILDGALYRVVGVVSRCEANHRQYSWREYQLFQPETGRYVQLAEYNGHWTLIWAASHLDKNREDFKLADFKLFNKYQPRINWALGEFDWDIERDDTLNVAEHINPPRLLVQERRGKEQQWYRGRHVAPDELASAFNISRSSLPHQEGTGAVEPAPGSNSHSALWTLTGILTAALVLIQLVLAVRTTSVLSQTIQVAPDTTATAAPGTGRVLVSPSFTLDHQTALDIELNATLSNQWLELPVSLVNEQTGRGFEFTKNIEFYSGVEGGESWSEGSRSADAVLSRVPAGRYHLNFYPFTEKGVTPEIRVNVWADPALPSNFFVVLGLILLVPGLQLLRRHSHERSRWSNSDYNPYATEE
ncbi:DUF4178 domain-containing protein [Microvirga sp. STS02]|uniref:DUF4178 domain-containing protein n=1 Tax=Hymenobacter negativus TaxID=2795026 RepID=UPI0018DAFDFD|nr:MULTISPECIES: DUF4178 domain-containing protein [Bacteria]MBH8569750.1 DUF4178 domain-containing protein [Hymenobacter negativus]MBR7209488.1 DUF4178 domain-containing protein [Microvirga sp. STS02]